MVKIRKNIKKLFRKKYNGKVFPKTNRNLHTAGFAYFTYLLTLAARLLRAPFKN